MADVLAVRNEYRLQSWMEIIRECEESGLSNREFCSQRGISEKTYYYWLRKARTAAATVIEPQLVRVDNPVGAEQMIEIRYGRAELFRWRRSTSRARSPRRWKVPRKMSCGGSCCEVFQILGSRTAG